MARPPALIPALMTPLIPVAVLGGAWWWAAVRLVFAPERTGAVERVVVAGGWGLSLLPVHVTSKAALRAQAAERALRRRRRAQHAGGVRAPWGDGEGPYGGGTGTA